MAITIDFSTYPLLAQYRSDGLYNLVGLGTWNGQPVSETNMPDATQRHLAATINFYGDTGQAHNLLYLQVTDVLATENAFWFGAALDHVTLTGIRITDTSGGVPPAGSIIFSDQFANPGQVRAYGGTPVPGFSRSGGTGSDLTELLTTTSGYQLDQVTSNVLLIHTSIDIENGFTSLCCISGVSLIRGGGVFQLALSPSIDVRNLDFANFTVDAEYGRGHQYITASFVVPEPASMVLVMAGLVGLVFLLFRQQPWLSDN